MRVPISEIKKKCTSFPMSVVVFAPRGRDYQTSHDQDELYIVMKGSGILTIEGTPYSFMEGDVLFVPAHKQHRFAEFSEGFFTWAIFWGPVGGEKLDNGR